MSDKNIYLKNYTPPIFAISDVKLVFDIRGLDDAIVTNVMHLQRKSEGICELDGEHLKLLHIKLDGRHLSLSEYQVDDTHLRILNAPEHFTLEIVTQLNPQLNTALSGLYASRTMLCTQCEAQGFRRITYYLDRPDVLSRFTTKIIADTQQFPCLLSNGNLVESGEDGHRKFVVWEDPFLKPCYLFALVAGDLAHLSDEFLTCSKRRVGIDIFVEHGDAHLCTYAMSAIKNAMRWDEQRFGREYDLERYMIVAVKDFNMGAMENKGLNIFNAKYVLADEKTATDEDILGIESVIGHEYFHNWTGNRVTCRDWFQLSLKEGLTVYREQSFSGDMNHPVVQRIADVANLRRVQFPEDRGALAHPVQPQSYQEINNFYTATIYEKGGEIVRMYETILGRDGFRRGMDLYFERHDGQAVTIDDFLAAMADANHYDFKHFKRWYEHSGTPVVSVRESFDKGHLKIVLSQDRKEPFLIPIRFAVYSKTAGKLDLPEMLMLEKLDQVFEFEVAYYDIVVNYLHGFSAPIILKRTLPLETILSLFQLEKDGFALWDLKQKVWIDYIQQSYHADAVVPFPAALMNTLKGWLQSLEHAVDLMSELFILPSYEECLLGLESVDAKRLARVRLAFEKYLALQLQPQFEQCYAKMSSHETIGQRSWHHVCLHYLMLADSKHYFPQAWSLLHSSPNMSDRAGALRVILATEQKDSQKQALDQFYQDWHGHELVMNKWFMMQAKVLSLKDIRQLVSHALFSWENPNKVYALIGGFTANHAVFHEADGSGYAFLTECILIVDSINPQVASRMVTPLTRFAWLDNSGQQQVIAQLKKLLSHALSANVFEMVSKSMALP